MPEKHECLSLLNFKASGLNVLEIKLMAEKTINTISKIDKI